MDATREIAKYGDRSVVEITTEGRVVRYAAVTNYDETKEIGSRWNWGHYYDIYGDIITQEEALKRAMLDLYNISDKDITKAKKYDRIKTIASDVSALYLEINKDKDVIDDAVTYLKDELNITKEEAQELGIDELLYPKKYQIIEVDLVREQKSTVKIVVPAGVDVGVYDADDYIDNIYYVEPEDEGDWEVDDVNVDEEDISKDEVKNKYGDEIWNIEDIDTL